MAMPSNHDQQGADDMSRPELLEPGAQAELGATHEANVRGEFRVPANIPSEQRIPVDQLPVQLRARFPEGMPKIGGESGLSPDRKKQS